MPPEMGKAVYAAALGGRCSQLRALLPDRMPSLYEISPSAGGPPIARHWRSGKPFGCLAATPWARNIGRALETRAPPSSGCPRASAIGHVRDGPGFSASAAIHLAAPVGSCVSWVRMFRTRKPFLSISVASDSAV